MTAGLFAITSMSHNYVAAFRDIAIRVDIGETDID